MRCPSHIDTSVHPQKFSAVYCTVISIKTQRLAGILYKGSLPQRPYAVQYGFQ